MNGRLLLDTDALLWLLGGDDRLGSVARELLESAAVVAVSVASLWEIAIKMSIDKLAPIPALHDTIRRLGFTRVDIADAHLVAVTGLPLLHRDPFDRLLIAQALVDDLTVVTSDASFAPYGVPVLPARC